MPETLIAFINIYLSNWTVFFDGRSPDIANCNIRKERIRLSGTESSTNCLKMVKYLTGIFLIVCLSGYVISLNCLSCTSKEACQDAPSTNCTAEQKYCLAVSGQGTYFRGCYDNEMDCEKLKQNMDVSFPVCVTCQENNCNNQDLN